MANENRKLASIQEIEKIEPIKKADRLEVATVLGWQLRQCRSKRRYCY